MDKIELEEEKKEEKMLTLRELHEKHLKKTINYEGCVLSCIQEIINQRIEYVKFLNFFIHGLQLISIIVILVIIKYSIMISPITKIILSLTTLFSGYLCLIYIPKRILTEIIEEKKQQKKERTLCFGSNLWHTCVVATLPIRIIQKFQFD